MPRIALATTAASSTSPCAVRSPASSTRSASSAARAQPHDELLPARANQRNSPLDAIRVGVLAHVPATNARATKDHLFLFSGPPALPAAAPDQLGGEELRRPPIGDRARLDPGAAV